MNPAFKITRPSGHAVALVLDSPHSGTEYPDDFRASVSRDLLRQSEDSFVDELYSSGPALGATLIAATFPRSYIDPNRSLLDIDATLIEGAWPGPAVPSRKTELGIGLIWRVLDSGEAIYGRKLSVDEVKQRIVRYHQPYQRAVKDALDEAHDHFGGVWHINCHSMPALSGRISEEGPGKPRADFVLGDRDGSTCEPGFTGFVAQSLRGMGYDVKINDPYKGVELVRAFSDPAAQRHSLQVEVNRNLYMDERTRRKSRGFDKLKDDIGLLLEAVARYVGERGSHMCAGPPHHGHEHGHGHHHHHDDDHDPSHAHDHSRDSSHNHGHDHGEDAAPGHSGDHDHDHDHRH
jgi:N-formylglutamate deformylase